MPYPTLEQEMEDMYPAPPKLSLHVISVEFNADSTVPFDAQEQISTKLQNQAFEVEAGADYMKDVANEIAEVAVRVPLQDRGYFTATTEATLRVLENRNTEVNVAAAISAEPGPQYRTGDIRIQSIDGNSPLAISPEVLRGLILLQRGEPLSVERLRAGLTRITKAYAREGYVDATVEPDLEIDEDRETIDVVFKIDQQVQYRIGGIEFWGVNTATEEKLTQSLPKPGDIFDGTRLEEFFKVNRAILPPDVSSEDVSVSRDTKNRTVAILFDFRTCPQNSN